ncbi:hypothetical protein GUJ93_ZPchr0010g10644 [Zizania palustris]|uniref:Uncharacterized protein n=1 Tax=Zizania palustris TaxID=103762 RepID=A0A8J6BBZ2_ZIZPA|nr:hypothetical protein GUJ93_ZPchr0010g10644 [Zizania palustris]
MTSCDDGPQQNAVTVLGGVAIVGVGPRHRFDDGVLWRGDVCAAVPTEKVVTKRATTAEWQRRWGTERWWWIEGAVEDREVGGEDGWMDIKRENRSWFSKIWVQ